jgi:hypothetical protein
VTVKKAAMKPFDSVQVSDLLVQAVESARQDPSRDSESLWELVRELHRRGGKLVFEQSVAWCGSPDPLVRCLGADVLGQLGYNDGYPFKAEASDFYRASRRSGENTRILSTFEPRSRSAVLQNRQSNLG